MAQSLKYIVKKSQHKFFPTTSIAVGKVGTGKTVKSRERAEYFHANGFSVIYLYDWGRFEAVFMNLPNPYERMWGKFIEHMYKYFGAHPERDMGMVYKPRGFKTYCHLPYVDTMPSKLPACFVPFKIEFSSLTFSEFVMLLASDLSKGAKDVLEIVWNEKTDSWSFKKFVEHIIGYASRGKMLVSVGDEEIEMAIGGSQGLPTLLRGLQNLWQSGLICDKGDKYALDMNKIMKDNRAIHSFSMAYMGDVEQSYLIYAYILRKIRELRQMHASRYPNLFLVINEAHELLPSAIEHSGQAQSLYYGKILLSQPRDIRLWAYLDTQRFIRLNKTIRGAAYTYYIFRSDMIEIDELSARYGFSRSVMNGIKKLETGACCVVTDHVDTPVFFPPPQSMCKSYKDDFFAIWTKYKLPMAEYDPVSMDKIFSVRRAPEELSRKEVRMILKESFKVAKFVWYNWEVNKKLTSLEEYLDIAGLIGEYFHNYVYRQEIAHTCIEKVQIKGRAFLRPTKIRPPEKMPKPHSSQFVRKQIDDE